MNPSSSTTSPSEATILQEAVDTISGFLDRLSYDYASIMGDQVGIAPMGAVEDLLTKRDLWDKRLALINRD